MNGGDARAKALQAVRSARKGNLKEAEKLMEKSKESLSKAHEIQTNLIQEEARGEKSEISLLMVHAQDHLMNAITVKDLAIEMIEEIKVRIENEGE